MVHAFTLPLYLSTSIKQSSIFGTVINRPRYNSLTYQPIELEKYIPYQSRINDTQHASTHLVSKLSTKTQHKYGVTSLHTTLPFRQLNQSYSKCHSGDITTTDEILLVFVGTKYGELVTLPFEFRNATWLLARHVPVEWPSRKQTATGKSPFPNYCIASVPGKTETMLLVGSADRYVHIWQRKHQSNSGDSNHRWNLTQRLGPHTGWVKSLATLPSVSHLIVNNSNCAINPINTDSEHHRFVSVGCNRIECWKYNSFCQSSESDTSSKWAHISTACISSSPTNTAALMTKSHSNTVGGTACTLSSDLLCLEVCTIVSTSNQINTILAVGGVDGRIHFYIDRNVETDSMEHLVSIVAHRGRVNVLSYDKSRRYLISGSHDGTIHCWSFHLDDISHNETLSVDRIASHQYHDGIRVTALLCFTSQRSNGSSMSIIAGTHVGSIHLLTIIQSKDLDKCEMVQISDIAINNSSGETNENGPMINAFCRLDGVPSLSTSPGTFVVGHSHGLGIVQIQGEATYYT